VLEVSFYLPGLNVATADFASVASFYTPAEDVLPAEYGVIIIWDGSSGQQFNAGNFSVQVCV
jgi:hypothetical protein